LYLRLGKVIATLSQELGRSPTIQELAAEAQVSEEEVLEAMEAGQAYRFTSLDTGGPGDEEGETLATGLGGEDWGLLEAEALAADNQVAMEETSRRGHAARLAQRAAAEGVDGVVVLGGDGTLNEAANGLAGSHTALGVLPGGSTNVFARTIGASVEPIEATGQLLAAMARGSRRRIGLGQVNGRYFLFHVGMGFDAAVVDQVERRADLKRYIGHSLFVYAAVVTWLRHYDHRQPRLTVQLDQEAEGIPSYLAICLNTNPYTFLGPRRLNLAPDATLDGPLTLVNFRTLRF